MWNISSAEEVSVAWPGAGTTAKGDVRDRGLLESAVSRPFQSAFGEDAYPDVHQKATALFHSLIANHPFGDGNKRTAVLALADFLLANGFLVRFSVGEMYNIAIRMASYRERSSSHGESFNEALASIRKLTWSLAEYKALLSGSGAHMLWYRRATNIRREIRKDKLNTLIQPQQK
jgi:death-on-curing protein